MHTSYAISANASHFQQSYHITGRRLTAATESQVRDSLDQFILPDGVLDAAAIREQWFPSIRAQVFISHSHLDHEVAVGLAGWLSDSFGITSFIDSTVWSHAHDLLSKLDRDYCRKDALLYDYSKRNRSTAHVHLLLSTALTSMMDQTEAVFFIRSNQSLAPSEFIKEESDVTLSPWLYHELSMMRLLRRRPLVRDMRKSASVRRDSVVEEAKDLAMAFQVDLSGVPVLGLGQLGEWKRMCRSVADSQMALDVLYGMYPS